MENLEEKIRIQLGELDKLVEETDAMLLRLKDVPNLRFEVSRSNGNHQYLWVDKDTKKRSYAGKADLELLAQVAQRDYLNAMDKKLRSMRLKLWRLLKQYDVMDLYDIYNNLSDGRKRLVNPVLVSTDEYVAKWLDDKYESMPFDESNHFYSNNGVRVRSKSELMIANSLEKYGVPYKYEKSIVLNGKTVVVPDFDCLNIRTRSEFVWEHFGMMDNMAYANKNVMKIDKYQTSGFLPGKNLIITFESSQNPLSTKTIENVIREYLL